MMDRRLEEKPACSVTPVPFPTEVKCASCGEEIEVWSDDTEITCGKCGSLFSNSEDHKEL